MNELTLYLPAAGDTDRVGQALANALPAPEASLLVELHGDLGMGKTALTRAFLRGLGVTGSVRSPTYTLCEPYEAGGWHVMHLDLYRLSDPEELDYIGVRELDSAGTLALVEWPGNGAGWLPEPALILAFSEPDTGVGRRLSVKSANADGKQWLQNIAVAGGLKDYM